MARAIAALNHRHLPALRRRTDYLVMEYVDSQPEGPVLRPTLRLAAQIADALARHIARAWCIAI